MMIDRDVLQERAGLYRLLHALYEYPLTADLLTAVNQLRVASDSTLAAGLILMQTYLAENGTTPEALNVEMTRLLEGPGQPAAPPYASYYLFNGRLMGPPAQAARQAYLEWNAWPDSPIHMPDDHVMFELGFLAYLAEKAALALNEAEQTAALSASRDFITGQLRPWLPRFCVDLSQASENQFFAGLAQLTDTAVNADLDWLTIVCLNDEPVTESAVMAN